MENFLYMPVKGVIMAKIKTDNKEAEVNDGDPIMDACEQLGVPFGCRIGVCGICRIEVEKGAENLSELTQEEKDAGMSQNTRLACRCRIKEGEVKIKF